MAQIRNGVGTSNSAFLQEGAKNPSLLKGTIWDKTLVRDVTLSSQMEPVSPLNTAEAMGRCEVCEDGDQMPMVFSVIAVFAGLGASCTGIIPYAGIDLCVFMTLKSCAAQLRQLLEAALAGGRSAPPGA